MGKASSGAVTVHGKKLSARKDLITKRARTSLVHDSYVLPRSRQCAASARPAEISWMKGRKGRAQEKTGRSGREDVLGIFLTVGCAERLFGLEQIISLDW